MVENFKNNRTIITVDCRELLPPEPMIKVMEAVMQMKDDEAVRMLHRHTPRHLFPKPATMPKIGVKRKKRKGISSGGA